MVGKNSSRIFQISGVLGSYALSRQELDITDTRMVEKSHPPGQARFPFNLVPLQPCGRCRITKKEKLFLTWNVNGVGKIWGIGLPKKLGWRTLHFTCSARVIVFRREKKTAVRIFGNPFSKNPVGPFLGSPILLGEIGANLFWGLFFIPGPGWGFFV